MSPYVPELVGPGGRCAVSDPFGLTLLDFALAFAAMDALCANDAHAHLVNNFGVLPTMTVILESGETVEGFATSVTIEMPRFEIAERRDIPVRQIDLRTVRELQLHYEEGDEVFPRAPSHA